MAVSFSLPKLGFGNGGLSGSPVAIAREESQATQRAVLEHTQWIDSALHYGAGNGLTDLGIALGEHPTTSTLISFKVGRVLEEPTAERPYETGDFANEGKYNRRFDYSREGVLKAYAQSLEFLNKGRTEKGWEPIVPGKNISAVVFIHDPEPNSHGANYPAVIAQIKSEALPALAELKKSGAIKAIGIGTNQVQPGLDLVTEKDLDLVMLAGRFTLLSNEAPAAPEAIKRDTRRVIELLSKAKRYGKQIVSASPGNSGLLYGADAPTPETGEWYNYRQAEADVLEFRDKIAGVFKKHGVPLLAGVVQFPLLAGASAVLAGARTPEQAKATQEALDFPIPPALWKELEIQGLIAPQLALSMQKPVDGLGDQAYAGRRS